MLCALIMAGGKGERFWPLSTDEKPKQFLNLLGDKSMIQMTVERLQALIPIERIFVVTGEIYKDLVQEQLPDLLEANIIMEPIGRNTAPCIALSAMYIKKFYNDAVIAVLPSDHLIKDDEGFLKVLSVGGNFVKNKEDAIVTIGINPDRPETGYGYIKFDNEANGEIAADSDEIQVLPVSAFVEKPSREKAQRYISEGNYLWNAGMFIWTADHIIELTKKHLYNTYSVLKCIDMSNPQIFKEQCKIKYPLVDNISVDYGIMEKAENIYIIPGDFGWDDIGSWFAVERYCNKDEDNNVHQGKVISIDSKENLVISYQKPIVVVGTDNLLVVESDELIFVCSKDSISALKDIKKKVLEQ
ncbi:mannose-1-phosphate guanylyltransferase [Clostridium thermarum]|uniref:mannose-1-phosphate guanylyltransferase n=1 Tax=Clostridium thermarum TaxID=1716543 RepID=UPI0011212E62|nr:mannose-1-phosphate guanylyltransferase [Clostridium thermarum]